MANYILDNSGNISHIKYKGQWVGQVNYKAYGASSPTRLSWQPLHTSVNGWFNNSIYHWQNCDTCGWQFGTGTHEGNYNEWSPYAYHDINANNHSQNRQRACFVCGYTDYDNSIQAHVWNIKGTWTYNSSDDANHYRTNNCICGHIGTKDKAAHSGGSTWLYNASRHYHNCTTCSHVWAVAPHTYAYTSVDRANHNNHCSICSWNKLEAHTDGTAWYKNAVNHWHKCTVCENDTNLYSHTWSNTNTNIYYDPTYHNFIWNNRCTVCDYNVITNTLKAHIWGSYAKVDDNNHRRNCTATGCTGYKVEGHNFNNYALDDNNHRFYCLQECGFSKTVAHTISYVDIGSDTQHNRLCVLCNYLVTVPHNYNSWSSWSSWVADNDNTCARTQNRKCNNCDHLQTNLQRNDHHWGAWTGYRWIEKDASSHVKTRNHTCENCTRLVYDNTTESHTYNVYGSWAPAAFDHHTRSVKCLCGRATANETASHIWTSNGMINSTYHYLYCGTCQGNYSATHTWSSTYTKVNNDQHRQACTIGCGAYHYTDHNITLGPWSAWTNGTWTNGSWGSWSSYDATQHRRSRTNTRINTRTRDRNCDNCGAVNIVTDTATESATEYGYAAHTWSNTVTGNYYTISNTQHNTQYNNHCTTTGCGYYQLVNVAEAHSKYASEWGSWSWGEWQNGTWSSWSNYNDAQHRRQRTNTRTGERSRAWGCYNCDYDYTETESGTDSQVQADYADHTWGSWARFDNATYHRSQCSGCSTYKYQTHSPTLEPWSADATSHWRLNYCSVCSYVFQNIIEPHTFVLGPWTNYNNTMHYRDNDCNVCGYEGQKILDSHGSYGSWTNYGNGTYHRRQCGICEGYNYGTHTWSYAKYNGTQHHKNCSVCGYHTLADHTWSAWSGWSSWTMDNNETHSRYNTRYCTTSGCGYTVNSTQTESHSLDPEWSYDDNNHWKLCGRCSYNNSGSHDIGYEEIGDESIHMKYCNICSYAVEQPHDMVVNPDITIIEPIDATYHGYYHGGKCSLCTYQYDGPMYLDEREKHTMRQGRCTICGYQP